ncbi:DUF192 domain-containing protein, partial [Streptomyces sp. MBT72]|nr:DUF192 domain-containing protein [Streptomyces sp. MBT72]
PPPLHRPGLRLHHVPEAEAGAMERWGVRPGVRLELKAAPAAAPELS